MKKIMLSVALLLSMLVGCSPEKLDKNEEDLYLQYEFVVGEQVNVSHYTIQGSVDGNEWSDVGIVLANVNLSDSYNAKVYVGHLFKNSNKIMTRIKSVDNDGKEILSWVTTVSK